MTILNEPSGEKSSFEGRLEGIGPPELIHKICLPGRTGILTLARGEICKKIYIKRGRLIFATSNSSDDRFGETLLRGGLISYRQFEEASRRLGSGKRLGAILVELGCLSPENLVRGVLDQVRDIILDLFPWEHGSYRFSEWDFPLTEIITLDMSTPRIVYEGVHRITSWPRIREAVGPTRTHYRLTRGGRQIAEELRLGAAERLILDMMEEPTTVGDVCRGVFLANFEVYQALWAFKILGVAREVETEAVAEVRTDAGETTGDLAETPVGRLLLELCRDEETGVLYLARDSEEKAIHIRQGFVAFATSNRAEDNLTSFLLRRGVISLRDRDEVERRLLSNKRAGTILREMGILSDDELVRFVSEQLREIVLSVFEWERGEWRFVSGDLPTLEGITLDRPVEELVLQGVRRVRDWGRICEGCGGLDTVLRPVESPSAALVGIELLPDEGEVLAALQVPRKVGAICDTSGVPDFRVAQVLWALQMIGAVTRAPAAPPAETTRWPAFDSGAALDVPESVAGFFAESPTAPVGADPARASTSAVESLANQTPPAEIPAAEEVQAQHESPAPIAQGTTTATAESLSALVEAETTPAGTTPAGNVQAEPRQTAPVPVERAIEAVAAAAETPIEPAPEEPIVVEAAPPAEPAIASAPAESSIADAAPAGSAQSDAEPVEAAAESAPIEPAPAEAAFVEAAPPAEPAIEPAPAEAVTTGESSPADSPFKPEQCDPADVDPVEVKAAAAGTAATAVSLAEPAQAAIASSEPEPSAGAKPGHAKEGRAPVAEVRGRRPRVADEPLEPFVVRRDRTRPVRPETGSLASGQPKEKTSQAPNAKVPPADEPLSPFVVRRDRTKPVRPEIKTPTAAPLREGTTTTAAAAPLGEKAAAPAIPIAEQSASAHAPRREQIVLPPSASVTRWEQTAAPTTLDWKAERKPPPPSPHRREVDRFNGHHRILYPILRKTIGASLRNVIAKCAAKLGDTAPIFDGLTPNDLGIFPAGPLLHRVQDLSPEDVRARLSSLLLAEAEFARSFLDKRSVERVSRIVERVNRELAGGKGEADEGTIVGEEDDSPSDGDEGASLA